VLAREARSAGADALLIVAPCIMRPATVQMLAEVNSRFNCTHIQRHSCFPSYIQHHHAVVANAWIVLLPSLHRHHAAYAPLCGKVIGMVANESTLPSFYYHYPALYGVDFPMPEFLQEVVPSCHYRSGAAVCHVCLV